MKKHILIFCIAMIAAMSVVGCGSSKKEKVDENPEIQTEEPAKSDDGKEDDIKKADGEEENTWWFTSYDWENCEKKELEEIELYGSIKFPFDIYDFMEKNVSEFTTPDVFYKEADINSDTVKAETKDVRRKDLYTIDELYGNLALNGESVVIDAHKRGMMPVGEIFADGQWNVYMQGFPHDIVGVNTDGCANEKEEMSKTIDSLGRPSYIFFYDPKINGAEDITKDFFERQYSYDLVWKIGDDHYLSIEIEDGPEDDDFIYYGARVGNMRYIESKVNPQDKNEIKCSLLEFDDVIRNLDV